MTSTLVVAVDGPSGSASPVRRVAWRRGWNCPFTSTQAMYRALTWWMLRAGVDVGADAVARARGRAGARVGHRPARTDHPRGRSWT
ncbi:MAG: (d)CMP kinase [Nocardioides sp.]